jgi:hypothetical protein
MALNVKLHRIILKVYTMDYIKRVLNMKKNIPPNVKRALDEIGDKKIISARVGRTPVNAIVQGTLRTIAHVPYDQLFHLFIELNLGESKWILEKIERINLVREDRSRKQGVEFTSSFPVGKTVNELFMNTQSYMGARFLPYQANSNNCQVFIMAVLQSNGLATPELTTFVKQDTRSIFKNNPVLRKFANTLTDLGGYFNAILQGGKMMKVGGNNVTTSDDLDKLAISIPSFHGCFTVQELPTLQNGYYIINLNGHSHWTLLYKGDQYCYYDSFGFKPPQELEDRIGEYFWNNRENQDLDQTSCGFYCIGCMKYMNQRTNKAKAMDDYASLFSKDTKKNDLILYTLLNF